MSDLITPEFADNPEPRCPVILAVDNSPSVEKWLDGLSEAIAACVNSISEDPLARLRVELAIITFGPVRVVRDFASVDEISPPRLKKGNGTPLGGAILKGIEMLEDRKAVYRANGTLYYRPWLFCLTDGEPTDSWDEAARRVHQGDASRAFSFFAVGVEDADMETLAQIAPPNRPPMKLQGLKFEELFLWLSASLQAVSQSQTGSGEQLQLPPVDTWAQVNS